MKECNLHTILRLPTGIFYAHGVKTNVIFLQKCKSRIKGQKADETEVVWVYDLRTRMPQFGKTNPLMAGHFHEFISAYGDIRTGKQNAKIRAQRVDFECFREVKLRREQTILILPGCNIAQKRLATA